MIRLFADWLTYEVFSLAPEGFFAQAVNFFIYDTIKIFFLLATIIFIISFIRTFFPPEKTKNILSHEKKYIGNIIAALLGIVTPFCSCSAVPLFLGFIEGGVPLGVTFSFLVASPMINEVALIMLWGMFGWQIALLYIGSGLIIAVISGIVIGMLKVENLLEDCIKKKDTCCTMNIPNPVLHERINYSKSYTVDILKKIWGYVIIGIGVGAWIHGYIPADFIVRYAGKQNWFAVPLATLMGIPLYSNAAGVIPLISVLTEKGVQLGTALAFMMAVTGLSLPEFLILRRVMKLKLILIFAGVVGAGIIFTGYLFNYLIR